MPKRLIASVEAYSSLLAVATVDRGGDKGRGGDECGDNEGSGEVGGESCSGGLRELWLDDEVVCLIFRDMFG